MHWTHADLFFNLTSVSSEKCFCWDSWQCFLFLSLWCRWCPNKVPPQCCCSPKHSTAPNPPQDPGCCRTYCTQKQETFCVCCLYQKMSRFRKVMGKSIFCGNQKHNLYKSHTTHQKCHYPIIAKHRFKQKTWIKSIILIGCLLPLILC